MTRPVGLLVLVLALLVMAGPSPADEGADHEGVAQSPAHDLPADHPRVTSHPPVPPIAQYGQIQFRLGRGNVKAILVEDRFTWVGTSNGLIRYQPDIDRIRKFDNTSGLLSNGIFHISRVRGELWVGTYGGGLSVLNPETGAWRNYNIPHGMGDSFVYDVLDASNGDIWIATWSGANRILGGQLDDPENWLLYTVENTAGGLPNDWVYALAEGANGEVWLATEGGLARFAGDAWTHWSHRDGLGASYEAVKADQPFKEDPSKHSAHHARQKKDQGLEDIEVAYNPNYIVSLVVDRDGTVWAGTWGGGLSRFDGTRWRTFTVADGLPGNHIFALARDHGDAIWAGTSRGMAWYDGETFHVFDRNDGLASEVVFSIAFEESGDVWVGGLASVTWFPDGSAEQSGVEDRGD